MKTFFKKIGVVIGKLFCKLWGLLKKRPYLLFGIIFVWGLPILLLSEKFVFTKNVNGGIKLTFVAIIVIFIVFMGIRKRVLIRIAKIDSLVKRSIIDTIFRAITYGLVFAIVYIINLTANKLMDWWELVGICWFIGSVLYIIDAVIQRRKLNGENQQ